MKFLKNKVSTIAKDIGGFLYSLICVIAVIFFFLAPIEWFLIGVGIVLACVGTFGSIWYAFKIRFSNQEAPNSELK